MIQLHLSSLSQTSELAGLLAKWVKPGDCLALSGEMGAGKSTFARNFLRALSQDSCLAVPSPTFSLVQPYETLVGPVYHYDLWRLSGPESLFELDWDEACEAIMLVEWPEHAGTMIPRTALWLRFSSGQEEEERLVQISGCLGDKPFTVKNLQDVAILIDGQNGQDSHGQESKAEQP